MEKDKVFLKRFPLDKQAQIEQFISWAEMLGLSGVDIRCIGAKLDRDRKRVEREKNMEIVKAYVCLPVGKNRYGINDAFRLKTARSSYRFESYGWTSVRVTSNATKIVKTFTLDYYEVKGNKYSGPSWRYNTLLNINSGKITLDF